MTDVSGVGEHRIVAHDPGWRAIVEDLVGRLRVALGPVAVSFEHIGSTSVPGLAARPIPDIQIAVRDVLRREEFVPALAGLGYEHFVFPELQVDDYLVFVPADGSNTVHLMVCEAGSHHEERHLAVRDYLRAHDDERDAYEATKRASASAAAGDRSRYAAGKDAFVKALEQRALAWRRRGDV